MHQKKSLTKWSQKFILGTYFSTFAVFCGLFSLSNFFLSANGKNKFGTFLIICSYLFKSFPSFLSLMGLELMMVSVSGRLTYGHQQWIVHLYVQHLAAIIKRWKQKLHGGRGPIHHPPSTIHNLPSTWPDAHLTSLRLLSAKV